MHPLATSSTRDGLNLKRVAARPGVHYMTAYRYVRKGQPDAERRGTERLATETAVEAFLGSRFCRSGRSRGSVIVGAPSGERHHLPIAIVADLVRLAGFDVLELGADTSPEAFAAAIRHAPRLVAVCIGITGVEHLEAAQATIGCVRAARADVPIVVGGQAVLNPEVAGILDATAWASDGRGAVDVIEALTARRRSGRPHCRLLTR